MTKSQPWTKRASAAVSSTSSPHGVPRRPGRADQHDRGGRRFISRIDRIRLGERGKFWFWIVGFWLAFMPLYVLGLMGVNAKL